MRLVVSCINEGPGVVFLGEIVILSDSDVTDLDVTEESFCLVVERPLFVLRRQKSLNVLHHVPLLEVKLPLLGLRGQKLLQPGKLSLKLSLLMDSLRQGEEVFLVVGELMSLKALLIKVEARTVGVGAKEFFSVILINFKIWREISGTSVRWVLRWVL